MDDYSFLKPIAGVSSIRNSALNGVSGLGGLSSLLSGTGKTDSSTSSEFKDILLMMLKGMNNSSLTSMMGGSGTSGSEDGSSDMFGMSSSMMMMPLMMTLLEKMMALDTQSKTGSASSALSAASGIQINQFDSEAQTGGDGINADCGPASLVMALHALGLRAAGETDTTSNSAAIDLARLSMVSDTARDGVDESGNRSDLEHNTFTDLGELARGAQAGGAKAQIIAGDPQSIRQALEAGAKVLVSGTFVDKSPLPWTGDRGADSQSAPGFATQHIVAVTGYDAASGRFTVNDPARSAPIAVDASTLTAFMSGNAGAVILYK